MSLYLKYRPTNFKQVHGNQETVDALQHMVSDPEECPHVFLLHGPTGCGKTTLARLVGKELGIKGQDLRELDSAQFTGIDTVRDIRKQAQYKSLEGTRRMWILDEVHAMSSQAQEGLLKILEDTPSHVYFALCTTDPQKLKSTLRGRCSQFEVKPLSDKEMTRLLIKVCKAENQPAQKKVILQIVKDSQGHPRAGLQILDQVLRVDPKARLKVAKQSAEQQNQSIELCRALIGREPWSKVRNILKGLKDEDPES
ncbi:MAG TPA: AAA family ATPase, partial [Massilibacterium sp.]|nr:AAA family ATPase [Massilibacterium sp.]